MWVACILYTSLYLCVLHACAAPDAALIIATSGRMQPAAMMGFWWETSPLNAASAAADSSCTFALPVFSSRTSGARSVGMHKSRYESRYDAGWVARHSPAGTALRPVRWQHADGHAGGHEGEHEGGEARAEALAARLQVALA